MRLSRNHVDYMAFLVLQALRDHPQVQVLNQDLTAGIVRHEVLENLQAEEQLEREAEELLKKHRQTIYKEGADYRDMVEQGKRRLAKQRGIII